MKWHRFGHGQLTMPLFGDNTVHLGSKLLKASTSSGNAATTPLRDTTERPCRRINPEKTEKCVDGAVHVASRVGLRFPWTCVKSVSDMSRRGKETWASWKRMLTHLRPHQTTRHTR